MPFNGGKQTASMTKQQRANKSRDIGLELHDWAVNEMKLATQGHHANTKISDVETFRKWVQNSKEREFVGTLHLLVLKIS